MEIPTKNIFKATYELFTYGYQFIQHNCNQFQSDIFQIKLVNLKAICIHGEEAARIFYNPEKMVRKGAVPPTVQHTLTGKNAIHTTDDVVHQHRKQMFNSLMTDENISRLNSTFHDQLRRMFLKTKHQSSVVLFQQAQQALCRAVCIWAGVPLQLKEVSGRAADFVAMVDAFGSAGLRNWQGMLARNRAERWLMGIIRDVRSGRIAAKPGTALQRAAFYRDESGQLFNVRMAAIELMNILRPTVAISWYIVFGAMAMHQYTDCRRKFIADENNYQYHFVDEVRRFYPFAPFMGARVRNSFYWQGYEFPKGALVLLDMYGTNHDGRLWEQPYVFNPERFKTRKIRPFDFLAQGGGDVENGHRCPGEKVTIELLKTALNFLTTEIEFNVPEQDLSVDLSRMPVLPKSGLIMSHVQLSVAYA